MSDPAAPRPLRYVREYLVSEPGMFVPAWLALWLELNTDVGRVRTRVRGQDRIVDEALLAIRHAAMSQPSSSERSSGTGTEVAIEPEPTPRLVHALELGAAEVGGLAGITGRAVRKAITDGRLPAKRQAGRWLIAEADARNFAARQRRTTT